MNIEQMFAGTGFEKGGWRDKAACAGAKFEIFVSGRPGDAKAICGECQVTAECRDYAIEYNLFGVWGNMTTLERKKYALANGIQRSPDATDGRDDRTYDDWD